MRGATRRRLRTRSSPCYRNAPQPTGKRSDAMPYNKLFIKSAEACHPRRPRRRHRGHGDADQASLWRFCFTRTVGAAAALRAEVGRCVLCCPKRKLWPLCVRQRIQQISVSLYDRSLLRFGQSQGLTSPRFGSTTSAWRGGLQRLRFPLQHESLLRPESARGERVPRHHRGFVEALLLLADVRERQRVQMSGMSLQDGSSPHILFAAPAEDLAAICRVCRALCPSPSSRLLVPGTRSVC